MQYEHRRDEFRQLLKKLDLTLVGVYIGANFIFNDILEEEFDKIEKVAELSVDFGAGHLVIGGGAVRAAGIQESDYESVGKVSGAGGQNCQEIRIDAELSPATGHMRGGAGSARQNHEHDVDRFVLGYGSYRSGGGDPVEVVRKYVDRIKYVHFKDYKAGAFLPLGEGNQNFAEMLSILRDANYGWITMELDSYEDPLEGAKISKTYFQNRLNIG